MEVRDMRFSWSIAVLLVTLCSFAPGRAFAETWTDLGDGLGSPNGRLLHGDGEFNRYQAHLEQKGLRLDRFIELKYDKKNTWVYALFREPGASAPTKSLSVMVPNGEVLGVLPYLHNVRVSKTNVVTTLGIRSPIALPPSSPWSLLGVRTEGMAWKAGRGAAFSAAAGVAVEAGRELVEDGKLDGGKLAASTVGNWDGFWEPLAAGTGAAMLAGRIAERLVPGGRLISTGAQILAASLGSAAVTGQLGRNPGRAVAGAAGATVGSIVGAAVMAPLLPPVGSFIGGVAGGMIGQVGGEVLHDTLFAKRGLDVATTKRPTLRGVSF
jgi:hypothetical protein